MNTGPLVRDALMALVAVLIFAVIWRLIRVFVYLGIGLLIVVSLPSLLHGRIPSWLAPSLSAAGTWLTKNP